MTDEGPKLANLMLDGIWGEDPTVEALPSSDLTHRIRAEGLTTALQHYREGGGEITLHPGASTNLAFELLANDQAVMTQLRTALTYPGVLMLFGLIVVVFVLVAVLPKFTAFFEGKEDLLLGLKENVKVFAQLDSNWSIILKQLNTFENCVYSIVL